MVTWGLLVSLILMPVILSYCGPIVCTIGRRQTRAEYLRSQREKAAAKMAALKMPDSRWDVSDDDDVEYSSDDSEEESLVDLKSKARTFTIALRSKQQKKVVGT